MKDPPPIKSYRFLCRFKDFESNTWETESRSWDDIVKVVFMLKNTFLIIGHNWV